MTVWRNHYDADGDTGNSGGFTFHHTKRAAISEAKGKRPHLDDTESFAERIEFRCTKVGILRALNIYAGHPDNR